MQRVLVAAALFAGGLAGVPSVADASDLVRVRGRTFRGTVVETRPRVLVRLRLDDGAELIVPWSEIVAIEHAEGELPPAATPHRSWYGWQTLLIDAGSLALMPVGIGFLTYAVGPPIVHAAHGRAGPALASFLLRVSAPMVLAGVGVLIGVAAEGRNGTPCGCFWEGPFVGGAFGLSAGMLGAMAIDDAVIAREPAKAPTPGAGSWTSPHLVVSRLSIAGDGEHGHAGWVGVSGSF